MARAMTRVYGMLLPFIFSPFKVFFLFLLARRFYSASLAKSLLNQQLYLYPLRLFQSHCRPSTTVCTVSYAVLGQNIALNHLPQRVQAIMRVVLQNLLILLKIRIKVRAIVTHSPVQSLYSQMLHQILIALLRLDQQLYSASPYILQELIVLFLIY